MNRVINLQQNLPINFIVPFSPKNGAFIKHKQINFITLYNSVIDTYGIFKTDKDLTNKEKNKIDTYPDIEGILKYVQSANVSYLEDGGEVTIVNNVDRSLL